jgi:hypothetical protein
MYPPQTGILCIPTWNRAKPKTLTRLASLTWGHPPRVGGHLERFPGVLAREELRNLDQIPLSSPPNSRGFHTRSLLVFLRSSYHFLLLYLWLLLHL